MPLMGKSKSPTPQEIYRARKQREEDEHDAFLPPGLVNHGNTCFMNSVLQGLFATPLLADVLRFSLPPSSFPILSNRSPQLTNGHAYGGDAQREWEDGMPLGDIFVNLMEKAWRNQEERSRASMSPKDILTRLGAKYDQYLDFRQQDAHELLRHLLDAMRMEELDIIKKRQPAPKVKRKRKAIEANLASSTASMAPAGPNADPIPEEERLTSFVDMVFGGRLASILVCDKCKKISCTYEDFNDLSLSIRAEDYEKARKRDRLRSFAHKLGMRGRTHARDQEQTEKGPRARSVPASPTTTGRPSDVETSLDQVINDSSRRRRSIDADAASGPGSVSSRNGNGADVQTLADGDQKQLGVALEERVSWGEDVRLMDGPQRDRDEDSWVKLRRRISVGMRKGNGKKHRAKSREPAPPLPSAQPDQSSTDDAPKDEIVDTFVDVKAPSTPASAAASPNSSPALGAGIALPKFAFVRRPSPSRTNSMSPAPSPSMSPRLSPASAPPLPRFDNNTRIPSTSALSTSISSHAPQSQGKHVRPAKPPKPSRAETAYLRRILADVPIASSPPFNLFRGTSSSSIHELADVRAYIGGIGKMGMGLGGQGQSLEDCLRMFTAVEVMDGENMVGCHRCWKIERGEYVPRGAEQDVRKSASSRRAKREEDVREEAQSGSDAEDDGDDDDDSSSCSDIEITIDSDGESTSSKARPELDSPLVPSLDLDDAASAPPGLHFDSTNAYGETIARTPTSTSMRPETEPSSAQVSVPSISMTAPDAPLSTAAQLSKSADPQTGRKVLASPSRDSLRLPSTHQHHARTPAERASVASVSTDASSLSSDTSDDDDDDDGLDTDTEPTEAVNSDSSSYRSVRASPTVQQHDSPSLDPNVRSGVSAPSPSTSPALSKTTSHAGASAHSHNPSADGTDNARTSKIPRSKRIIPRRTYKRYLIATPPPVLVVHLKRFQQVGRTLSMSLQHQFFSNFKKLDDPVGVPEYLDLQPFLMPRKSEFFKAGKGKHMEREGEGDAKKDKGQERCMYRLYAVVVHIGNMLGGHYISYTALPEAAPMPALASSSSSDKSADQESGVSSKSDANETATTSAQASPSAPRLATPRSTAFVRSANPAMRSLGFGTEVSASTSVSAEPHSNAAGTGMAGTSSSPSAPARQWCYVSDTVVRLATLEEVLKAKAYICMYERV